MNTKRILFSLLVATGGLLVACATPPAPPTAAPLAPTEAAPMVEPTAAPTIAPAPDSISVVQGFYAALKAKDVDAAVALLADNVRWRGTPTLSGKESIRAYLQGDVDAGRTAEISDLRVTRNRVTYTWAGLLNDVVQLSGEDTMVVVDGKIAVIESYASMGADARPDIAEIAFTTTDYAFDGPDAVKAGWVKIALTGMGQEPHHVQVIKLEEGKTLDDLKAALTADPENFPAWAVPYGGPNAPDPGGTTSAILYLDAGSYAVICVIPDAQGMPHYQHGMMKALTVTEATGIMAGEPRPDITVDLADFAFSVSGSLTAGEHIIRFNNTGTQVHEAFLVKLADGKTAEDYLNAAPGTIPPGVSLGGTTGITPGEGHYVGVTLESGNYALFCFFPDPNSHAPHFALGMVQEFAVK
jgi:ketosteroid isomerase-like protein